MANQSKHLQLIAKDMALDEAGLRSFVQTVLDEGGERARYEVISILGPQSSGRKTYSPRQFASEAQKQWQMINEHPELNIQTYKESIDQNRCNELTRKYIRSFEEELRKLERRPTGFSGHEVGKIVHHFLEEYNEATRSFTASVTSKEQETLKYELLKNWKNAFDKRKTELLLEILRSFGDALETRLNSDPSSDAKTIVESCITESLEKYQEQRRGMIAEHVQWDTTDADSLLRDQLGEKAADIFYSVKQNTTLSLVKDSFIAALLAGAVTVDAVVAGGTATLALLGTAAAVTGGAAALAGGVAAAHAYPIFGAVKKVCNGANFFIKNRNYRPEKPSASDNLEKP